MNDVDLVVLALTAWRENDRGGHDGMQSVINSVMNRAKARQLTPYEVCTQHDQYTSVNGPANPDQARWPAVNDRMWLVAQTLASDALQGVLPDITGGAVNYYAASMKTSPYWAAKMVRTVAVAGHIFFKEAV